MSSDNSRNSSHTTDGSSDSAGSDGNHDLLDPIDLDPSTSFSELNYGESYHGRVNNIVEYGVFVTLAGDLSGLVHNGNFPPNTSISDFSVGDPMIVEVDEKKPDGDIALNGLDAPAVETGARGIPPSKTHGEEVFEEIQSLREDIEALHGTGDMDVRGDDAVDFPRVQNQYRDAIETLRSCVHSGFTVEEYATNVTENGDRIEITVTASKTTE